MDKDAIKVHFVSDDDQTFFPLPRFVTRTTLKDLLGADVLDKDPLEPDAAACDAAAGDPAAGDPAAPPTTP